MKDLIRIVIKHNLDQNKKQLVENFVDKMLLNDDDSKLYNQDQMRKPL